MSTIQHALLVSAEMLKRTVPISQSCDDNLIHTIILQAQDKYILPVLGHDLFEKIKSDIADGTLTGVYATLVKTYINKAICQFTYAMLLPNLRIRSVRHSVVQMDNEQGTSVSADDIAPLVSQAMDMGEFYRERLIDYLVDNSSSYPEYSSNTGNELSPTTRNYYSGINMDRNYGKSNILAKAVLSAMGVKDVC
tara:strand:+ start:5815 stop:6396 length:582 start_codon:yes stop_codon:yes gene_type:complete